MLTFPRPDGVDGNRPRSAGAGPRRAGRRGTPTPPGDWSDPDMGHPAGRYRRANLRLVAGEDGGAAGGDSQVGSQDARAPGDCRPA